MTCETCRQELRTRSVREFAELRHLDHCEGCQALARDITTQEAHMHATIDDWIRAPIAEAPRRSRLGRRAAAVLLAIAALATLWLALPGPPPVHAPAAPPVAELRAGELELTVGSSALLTTPRPIREVTTLDPAVGEASVLDEGRLKLHLVGRSVGETEVRVDLAGATAPMVYNVVVRAAREDGPDDDSTVRLGVGSSVVKTSGAELEAAVSSDPAIATVERSGPTRYRIEAVAPGVTDVVVTYPDGPPEIWVVVVR